MEPLRPIPSPGRESAGANAGDVSLDGIAALLGQQPAAGLIAELEALLALVAPAARRSGPGAFFDRLLGRDLVLAAHPDPVEARIRLQLERSAASAEATARFLVAIDDAREGVDARLRAFADARPYAAEGTSSRVDALHASWLATRAHLDLARATAAAALERHRDLREVVLPLWREGRVGEAATAHARLARDIAALRIDDRLRTVAPDLPTSSEESPP